MKAFSMLDPEKQKVDFQNQNWHMIIVENHLVKDSYVPGSLSEYDELSSIFKSN